MLYTSRGIPEEAEQGESHLCEGGERVNCHLDLSRFVKNYMLGNICDLIRCGIPVPAKYMQSESYVW